MQIFVNNTYFLPRTTELYGKILTKIFNSDKNNRELPMTEVLNVLVQNEYNMGNVIPAGIGDG